MLKSKLMKASLVVAGLALSAAASAQVYGGASIGRSQLSADCSGTISCSNDATSYKLFGGYQFHPNFAVEASYSNLGKTKASFYDTASSTSASMQVKSSSFELAAVANQQFTSELSGFAKLGIASVKAEGDMWAVNPTASVMTSTSTSSTQPVWGLGLNYKLTKELALRAEFESRKVKFIDAKETVRNLNVGLQYQF
jgi:OOP family OmpA-OmpF porin